ncbi:MAG: hypothetical protein Q6J74_09535, partial [Gloeomargarita sp. DG02_1_bins_92]
RLLQAIALSPNSVFETDRTLNAGETHVYSFAADPTPESLALVLLIRSASRETTVDIVYPGERVMENVTNGTYELSEAGEYQVKIYGGRGRYRLRLQLVPPSTPAPTPPTETEREEPRTPDVPFNPRLPGR